MFWAHVPKYLKLGVYISKPGVLDENLISKLLFFPKKVRQALGNQETWRWVL